MLRTLNDTSKTANIKICDYQGNGLFVLTLKTLDRAQVKRKSYVGRTHGKYYDVNLTQ